MLKKLLLLCSICSGITFSGAAQVSADYALQLEATVNISIPQVQLHWLKKSGASSYNLWRKDKTASAWSFLGGTTDTFYNDATVLSDTAYEYKVSSVGASVNGTAYTFVGVNSLPYHQRGSILLLIDSTYLDSCALAIEQVKEDLSADGWALAYRHVAPSSPDSIVRKAIIQHTLITPDLQAVFIIGHVAVPYSGDLNPDAHPDHLGAWPADVYYGTIGGTWTDAVINDTVASRAANKNIPGDGKWDQSSIPTIVKLQVGRIDFSNMPAFAASPKQLLLNYLKKAHLYKIDSLSIIRSAIIDDNFGAFYGEAFGANGWRNFPPLVGSANVKAKDLLTSLKDSAYLWAYGCGAGHYSSCSGVGTTTNIAAQPIKGIFVSLFGSYFGDWDNQNNILRAPLCASEPALASFWAGRPNWFLHHMALDETIGYSTRLTQNNYGSLSPWGVGVTGVHVALMGDPSLRNQYIKPAQNINVTALATKGAQINWSISPEPGVIGYYVYRSDSLYGHYQKISNLVVGTSFKDTVGKSGLKYYMVRACKLETVAAGTYYNLSLGIKDTATIVSPPAASIAQTQLNPAQIITYPNPCKAILQTLVQFNLPQNYQGSLVFRDLNGKIVLQKEYQFYGTQHTISTDIQHLSSGIYSIEILQGQKRLNVLQIQKID